MRRLVLALLAVLAAWPIAATAAARLTVEGERFVLTTADGRRLTSSELVGAVLDVDGPDGSPATIRIDAVTPAAERAAVLLHALSIRDAGGAWVPLCDADAQGRKAAFPVAGRWEAGGRYIRDPAKWFLTCTSGSQAKCILWGYDPWDPRPLLAAMYEACQHVARADYDGRGTAHTRNGTAIDIWDSLAIQTPDPKIGDEYRFEAGWGPGGAVCVARTRWADLLPLDVLLASAPRLAAAPCDEAEARRRGAVIFTRIKPTGTETH